MKRWSSLQMTVGASGLKAAARSAVSWNSEFSDARGSNCLGRAARDRGHSRVPEPPERITGNKRCSAIISNPGFADFNPEYSNRIKHADPSRNREPSWRVRFKDCVTAG